MQRACKKQCRAKINLSIDVLSRLPNGYHSVRMVMIRVNIFDTLSIELRDDGAVRVRSDSAGMPEGRDNLAVRAAEAFFERAGIKDSGCDIFIEKRIPMGAGMAGGSADAAGVINGLNELFGGVLTLKERMELGAALGADVPYCIHGGSVLAEGIGEVLTPLGRLPELWYVIAKPGRSVSTKWVYENLDFTRKPSGLDIDGLTAAIRQGSPDDMFKNMGNVLENAAIKVCPEIADYKREFLQLGADFAMMSGSGSAVFGVFKDKEAAEYAYRNFEINGMEGKWLTAQAE